MNRDGDVKPKVSAEDLARDGRTNIFATSRLIIFISISIMISFVMVMISMHLYQISGAAQLDLSRPSYEDVRSEAQPVRIDRFDSAGPIDKNSLDKFKKLYNTTTDKISKKKTSFSSDAISDETLSIKAD